jgi:hypothetical protein
MPPARARGSHHWRERISLRAAMRRSPWTRILSAFFAVWLALVMGEAGVVHHHCPMHDGPAPGIAGGDMAGHAAHGGQGAPNGGHHACTCLGACSATSAVTLVDTVGVPIPALVLAAAAAPDSAVRTAPAARAHFSLPFANGPPPAIA